MGYKSYILPAFLALILHLLVLGVLSVQWGGELQPAQAPRHIQAQVVDLSALRAKQEAKELAQAQARAAEQARAQAQKRQAQQRAQADRARKAKAEAERKARAEAKRREATRQQQLAEKKAREAKIAAHKKEAERQQALAAKRKAEQEKAARAAAEKRRKAEEQKRLAEAKAQKARMDELAALMEADAQQFNEKTSGGGDSETRASMSDYIQSVLMANWRLPATARKGMLVIVSIRLLPNGQVDAVAVQQSSGNSALDRSAEQAVWRVERFARVAELARQEPVFFERNLRRITVNFRPENSRW